MHIYCVYRRWQNYIEKPGQYVRAAYRRSSLYQNLFHGYQDGYVVNEYGKRPYKSPRLIRNVESHPEVFFESSGMVVSQDVRERLSTLPFVDFVNIGVSRVIRQPMDEASVLAVAERLTNQTLTFNEWLDLVADDSPTLAREESNRYSCLICPAHRLVKASGEPLRTIQLPNPIANGLPFVELNTSAELHRRYPVLQRCPFLMFNQTAFELIAKDVSDEECFSVDSFDV